MKVTKDMILDLLRKHGHSTVVLGKLRVEFKKNKGRSDNEFIYNVLKRQLG